MRRFLKLIISMIMCLVISILLILLLARARDCTLGDLAYNWQMNGNINEVYICENNKRIPFIVLENKNNKTLLLRKEVMATPRRINGYSSYYENSEIDKYLNSDYLNSLGDLDKYIIPSNIGITSYESIGISGSSTININRKVFLLSISNIMSGVVDNENEGEVIKYFKDNKDKCADSWWLRTPDTYWLSCTYTKWGSRIGSTNSYDLLGIRPAFYLPSNTKVQKINSKHGSRIELILESN